MLGLVISDQVVATLLGVSFTSILALMAWIVRTLATLSAKVESQGDRLDGVDKQIDWLDRHVIWSGTRPAGPVGDS